LKKKILVIIPGEGVFGLFLLILFVITFYLSTQWGIKARLFPQIIVISGIVISA